MQGMFQMLTDSYDINRTNVASPTRIEDSQENPSRILESDGNAIIMDMVNDSQILMDNLSILRPLMLLLMLEVESLSL